VDDDRLDFDSYVAARRHSLTRTAYLLTGDYHAAEDLVQIALAKVYLARRRVRIQAVDAYVRRTMVNEHSNWWRRAWRRLERSTPSIPEPPASQPVVGSTDNDQRLWDAIQALAPRQRAVVVLRYYEDLSEAEIADVLGCSPGTVKSTSSRALTKLRNALGATPATTGSTTSTTTREVR
jgi:RNA polymerase sigma-70 factor (sigma-E family)